MSISEDELWLADCSAVMKMPYQEELDSPLVGLSTPIPAPRPTDWRAGLPSLVGSLVTLREVRPTDAPSLFVSLTGKQVSRFIPPPPPTVDGFERFIAWASSQRAAGRYGCFAVVPHGSDLALGIFQVRSLEPAFGTAEWGFAIASEFWGSGIFTDAAPLVVDFVFDVMGTRRLEARAALRNGRGIGALRKLGAIREGVLRGSLERHGEVLDQALWTILSDEWRNDKDDLSSRVIH